MENKKISLLIIGIIMNCAGTEKSFLAFADTLDYSRYDVTLLLARKEGALTDKIPPQIKVITMDEKYADMFLLTAGNSIPTVFRCFVKSKWTTVFKLFPYFAKICLNPKKKADIATRMWCDLMKTVPDFEGNYDVAAAYWGDRTMFFMCDKVNADKKIAWLHFDYENPPREDALYLDYFSRCDRIVTVSQTVNDALCRHLPEIAFKTTVIENINSAAAVMRQADEGKTFPDTKYIGKRILTVARICNQKGQDMALNALKRLCDDGYEVRWYFVGGGSEADVRNFKMKSVELGIADCAIYLGPTDNPYAYMRDCDIFALTSRYEGKPITVEEAKMLCKPIVATKYLSASEQLDGGRFGMLCDATEEGIYLAVRRLVQDESKRNELIEALKNESFDNTDEIKKFYAF